MFTLQLGHPKIFSNKVGEFSSIAQALRSCFRPNDEASFLFWNKVPIRMRYQTDLAASIDQVIAMCWLMSSEQNGASFVTLQTHLCSLTVEFQWQDDTVNLHLIAHPHDELYITFASVLNAHSELSCSKQEFLCEWNGLLEQVNQLFVQAGASIADGKERRKLELLQTTIENIGSYGRLYIQ